MQTPDSPSPRSRRPFFLVAGAFLIILIAASLIVYPRVQRQWTEPLGPSLDLPTLTPSAEALAQAQSTPDQARSQPTTAGNLSTAAEDQADEIQPTGAALPTPTPAPLCGGPPVSIVLGVGVDTRGETYNFGLGDVIRIARVDFVTPKVTVFTIPRDLWVEIPGISDHYGITHGKLNQSYFYGVPGMGYYDGPGEGPGLMARTLDLNFGLRVDHYGAVNMKTFEKIVDAVGGIDLYVPRNMDGRSRDPDTDDMGFFPAGQHHFTGDEALRFSRIRKRYNDLTRQDNQTLVLCALKKKLTTPAVLTKIPKIINAFQGQVLTDLSLEQMTQFACLLPQVDREDLIFTSLPDEIFEPGRVFSPAMGKTTSILEVDFDVIRDYVDRFMAGTWPSEPDEPSCP